MKQLLEMALSDCTVIIYEGIAIVASLVVGIILNKKIQAIKTLIEEKKQERLYSELDSELQNSRRK